MAAPVEIYNENETFYVPHFEVKIAGGKLPTDVLQDVMQVTYKDSVDEIDSFELTVNNWDAAALKPKYEPSSSAEFEGVFDPGKKLDLSIGYIKNVRLMITGEITSLEPNFPESGSPTLSVRGLNVLHSFRTEQHTFSWDNKRDSDIAVELGKKKVQSGQPGLGIEVRVDPRDEQPETYVLMNNQYDIVFLLERARKHDYEVVLRDDDTGRYLFFGPSDTKRVVPTYRLSWGQTLSSFRPTLTTAKQISEVVVRGWDRRANKAIEESAKWTDLVKDENEKKRLTQLAQAFGNRKEIITDRPVHTVAEAKELAQKILKNQLSGMVQGSGATVGLPDLRAGRKVVIDKLGPKFDGEYFITKSTHTINDSGYRTQFEARRDPTDQSPATEPK